MQSNQRFDYHPPLWPRHAKKTVNGSKLYSPGLPNQKNLLKYKPKNQLKKKKKQTNKKNNQKQNKNKPSSKKTKTKTKQNKTKQNKTKLKKMKKSKIAQFYDNGWKIPQVQA